MSKLAEFFRVQLGRALEPHGAVASAATKSGLSRQTVDHWIAGRRVPDLDQVQAIADALEKPPQELLFRDISPAWREVIRRIGDLDESQVSAVIAGISAALAAIRLDEKERGVQNSHKLPRSPKR